MSTETKAISVEFVLDKDAKYFNSKNAQKNLKKAIKKLYNSCQDTSEFADKLADKVPEFQELYVKKYNHIDNKFDLRYFENDDDIDRVVVDCQYEMTKKQELRMRLKQRIADKRNDRFFNRDYNEAKRERVKLRKDPRVTKDMTDAYYSALLANKDKDIDIPNPIVILDDLDDFKLRFAKFVKAVISNQEVMAQEKLDVLENSYSLYLELMTGFSLVSIKATLIQMVKASRD